MPALGSILALRDIEKTRTIKTILNLPSKQLEIIRSLSDLFAPDLASNLNTTNTSDSSKTNQIGSYLSQERRSGNEVKLEVKPSSVPFISDYDQVMVDDAQNQNSAPSEVLSKEIGLLGSPESKTTYSNNELDIIIESMKSNIDSRITGLNHLQRLIQQ
jgi:hypothetical protein